MVLVNMASGNHQELGVASRRFPLSAGLSKRTLLVDAPNGGTLGGERSLLTKSGGAKQIGVLAAAVFVSQVHACSLSHVILNLAMNACQACLSTVV